MMKLRILAVAVALAAVSPALAADAELDGSWNTKYGMIFELHSPLAVDQYLGDYQNGIGVQYNLAPDRAIRATVSLARASDKPTEGETKVESGGVTTTTKTWTAPTYTSIYDVNVGAAYIIRMGNAALAPYYGVGAGLGINLFNDDWENDITVPNQTTTRNQTDITLDLGAGALLGLEWRIHKVISVFAEYGVNLSLVNYERNKTEVEVKNAGGTTTTTTKSSKAVFFNLDTGINTGAQLGLLAHF
jgi:opacity protein-like surface antigen